MFLLDRPRLLDGVSQEAINKTVMRSRLEAQNGVRSQLLVRGSCNRVIGVVGY